MTAGAFYMKKMNKPKNVRNNNPLNMKESADWKGERLLNLDATFEEFQTPEYGFRAGYIDLLQKLERGVNTVESIINVWAPSPTRLGDDHNDTDEYIEYVADKMKISEFQEITHNDLPEMMLAMSEFEGSKGHFTLEQAEHGVIMAQEESFVIARLERLGGMYA
jgi:hypothetical protein